MKKEIRTVDKEKGILQVTTCDERWYIRDKTDPKTGLPFYEFVPSVTWICDNYPKGVGFYKWLASKGWDEAEAIKNVAGDKGSRVHYAIRDLIEGKTVRIDSKYKTSSDDTEKEISLEEYGCVMSFKAWYDEVKPEIIGCEFVVWGNGYAGTVDLLCKINGVPYIVDFKTSQQVFPSHELQVTAYKHAIEIEGEIRLAILQVGYRMNKKHYKFTEIEDQYAEFLAAKTIWEKETRGVYPLQRDYPLALKLELKEIKNEATQERKNTVRENPKVS